MLYRAATDSDDPGAVALTARYVRHAVRQLIYETNQLHGAIGLTLEYPLHLWSYRLRWLQGELTERLR
jgi:alkylation response protein AidB-like acyl-CoA dehydrogenase